MCCFTFNSPVSLCGVIRRKKYDVATCADGRSCDLRTARPGSLSAKLNYYSQIRKRDNLCQSVGLSVCQGYGLANDSLTQRLSEMTSLTIITQCALQHKLPMIPINLLHLHGPEDGLSNRWVGGCVGPERMPNEAGLAYFKILSEHAPEENQDSRSSDWETNN